MADLLPPGALRKLTVEQLVQKVLGLREDLNEVVAERDALRAAILDFGREDTAVHRHDTSCPASKHVLGEDCGAGDAPTAVWECSEGLSYMDCRKAERERCNCGLVGWRAKLRDLGDLARGFVTK